MKITTPRGVQDILPADAHKWRFVTQTAENTSAVYGYERIDFPMFEDTALFSRSIGEVTDIVEKEMYTFTDKAGRSLTLRPEGTASVARAYVQHNIPPYQLWKVYYTGSIFRYERPQAGRFREHHQFGVEAFGSPNPALDVEVMKLALDLLNNLGLTNLYFNINSIGCSKCRPDFKKALVNFLKDKLNKLCSDCQKRLEKNPLRILDCKNVKCREQIKNSPVSLDYLCLECKEHFESLKKHLEKLKLPYKIDPYIIRGLDYYTKTVFEIISESLGAQNSLCGGGRYDDLIQKLGGRPTPAVGFGMGLERVIIIMEKQGIKIPASANLEIFIVTMGESAFSKGLEILYKLRKNNISSDIDYTQKAFKSQLKSADRLKAKYALIIGEEELKKGEFILKDMSTGSQETLTEDLLTAERLQKN